VQDSQTQGRGGQRSGQEFSNEFDVFIASQGPVAVLRLAVWSLESGMRVVAS
jgi:hypothetical protein